MSNKLLSNPFEVTQNEAFVKGSQNRLRFLQMVQKLSEIREGEKYPHKFIYGYSGIGKSFEITNHLRSTETNHVTISGVISMYSFGVQLAVINHLNVNQERIIVFCDDIDMLFANETNCNILKSALHEPKMFTYEKSLQSQWSSLSDVQKDAITAHMEEGKMGFQVPTHNMTFIFVSNIQLPTDDEVYEAKMKGKGKASLLAHKNAIRSRCMVQDFSLTNDELFGWIADVIFNTPCLDRYNFQMEDKTKMLDFLWNNWSDLNERSVRLIEKMSIIMIEYPNDYEKVWKIDFLK